MLTQAEFAELTGFNPKYVSTVEVGGRNAGPQFLRKAVEVLGCTIDDITDGAVPRRSPKADDGQPTEVAS